MSDTVNIPAKQDFSLFQSGADTTPDVSGLSDGQIQSGRR